LSLIMLHCVGVRVVPLGFLIYYRSDVFLAEFGQCAGTGTSVVEAAQVEVLPQLGVVQGGQDRFGGAVTVGPGLVQQGLLGEVGMAWCERSSRKCCGAA